jgi:hypothetical protein
MPNHWITWKIEIEAETPLHAARAALAIQRDPLSTATEFEVGYQENGSWKEDVIDLDLDNPLGRPPAVIKDEEVCCGHCGSADTRYVEDVGQFCRLWVENGIVYASGLSVEQETDSLNARLWCCDCGEESELPAEITWT